MLSKHRAFFLRISSVVLTTGLGYVWLAWKGPVLVVRGSTTLSSVAPTWYLLSAFPILGILLADWVALLVSQPHKLPAVELGVKLGLLVLISSWRLDSRIPVSGHVLLFAYFLVRRRLIREPVQPFRQLETGLGVTLFALTSYVKLVWWTDVTTWGLGSLGGALLAGASWLVLRSHPPVKALKPKE